MKILVTGGTGFIGTHLVSGLLKEGHDVSVYDKHNAGSQSNLCILGDIRHRESVCNAMTGIDVVYHLAAEHRDDVQPLSFYYDVNVRGAQNVVRAAEENNIQKIIFTSTVALYGLNVGEPHEESPPRPFNDYSKSKMQSEEVFDAWVKDDDTRCLVIVRPVVIFGEGNRGNVFELIRQIASGKFVMVGNGKNKKSMGYVLNIASFLVKLLELGPGRHVYNYADKPDLTVQQLVSIVYQALGKTPGYQWRMPYPLGLAGGYLFDLLAKATGKTYPISSIRIKKFVADTGVSADKLKETGFVAPYSLAEGLGRMIASEFSRHRGTEDAKT